MKTPGITKARRSLGRILLGCFFAALLFSASSAQVEHRGTLVDARAGDGEARTFAAYSSQCPVSRHNPCDVYSYPVKSRDCKVVGIDSLGGSGAPTYLFGRYLSSTTYQETENEIWTCESDAAVLLEASSDSSVVPVWEDATERTFEFIRGARMADHGRASIVAVQYCLNGTGGCTDNLLLRRDGVWRFLDRDSTWNSVYAQLPTGYRIHKSPAIDVENLTWEQHIAAPDDPNCCPSGRILFDLDLVDGWLRVKRARLEAILPIK